MNAWSDELMNGVTDVFPAFAKELESWGFYIEIYFYHVDIYNTNKIQNNVIIENVAEYEFLTNSVENYRSKLLYNDSVQTKLNVSSRICFWIAVSERAQWE